MFDYPIDNYLCNYMDSILNNNKLFSDIYYLKKTMLIFENIHGESSMIAYMDTIDKVRQTLDSIQSITELHPPA